MKTRKIPRDVNGFTMCLASAGCLAIFLGIEDFHVTSWLEFLMVVAMSIGLSVFPIRLVSGVRGGQVYATANIGYLYLLLHVGFSAAIITQVLEIVSIFLFDLRKRKISSISWFRVLASIGIYFVALGMDRLYLELFPHASVWIQSFVVLMIFDAVNQFLLFALQASVGNHLGFHTYLAVWRDLFFPLFICSAILATVLQPSPAPIHFFLRCVYATLILVAIIYVTRRHSDEAERHQTIAAKYRAITDNTLDCITVVDRDFIILYASPAHQALIQRSPSEMEGKSLIPYILLDDALKFKAALKEVLERGDAKTLTIRFMDMDGRAVVTELTAAPALDENEAITSIVIIARDQTERLTAEEMLRKSERLAAVGQLAAGVAHEIRNPLTTVKGFLQIVEQSPADWPRFSPLVRSEVERIESIISEFLVWSKPQFGRRSFHDVVRIMSSVVSVMSTQAVMRGVSIDFNSQGSLPSILCDEVHIKQVFVNIVKNGIEAMPSGGRLSISIGTTEDGISVSVKDEGVGIPPELLSKIGDPFFTTKSDGTGLGMMVTFKIIHDHGGNIDLISDGRSGTTVRIELPVNRQSDIRVYQH